MALALLLSGRRRPRRRPSPLLLLRWMIWMARRHGAVNVPTRHLEQRPGWPGHSTLSRWLLLLRQALAPDGQPLLWIIGTRPTPTGPQFTYRLHPGLLAGSLRVEFTPGVAGRPMQLRAYSVLGQISPGLAQGSPLVTDQVNQKHNAEEEKTVSFASCKIPFRTDWAREQLRRAWRLTPDQERVITPRFLAAAREIRRRCGLEAFSAYQWRWCLIAAHLYGVEYLEDLAAAGAGPKHWNWFETTSADWQAAGLTTRAARQEHRQAAEAARGLQIRRRYGRQARPAPSANADAAYLDQFVRKAGRKKEAHDL